MTDVRPALVYECEGSVRRYRRFDRALSVLLTIPSIRAFVFRVKREYDALQRHYILCNYRSVISIRA